MVHKIKKKEKPFFKYFSIAGDEEFGEPLGVEINQFGKEYVVGIYSGYWDKTHYSRSFKNKKRALEFARKLEKDLKNALKKGKLFDRVEYWENKYDVKWKRFLKTGDKNWIYKE